MSIFDPFLEKMKLNDDDEEYMFEEDELEDEEDDDEEDIPVVREKRQPIIRKQRRQRDAYPEMEEEDEEDERPQRQERSQRQERQERPARSNTRPARSNVVSMRSTSARNGGMEVCLIKPTSFDDGREICDTLLSGRSVVVNLEGIPTDIAQRIIDFTSGACYSMDGNLQKISNYIVIVTPRSVELTGDFNDVISADGINVSV